MNSGDLIPMVLFVCILAAIKIVVESKLRKQMMENHVSAEQVQSMLAADEQARRGAALKWGLVLTLVGLAFGLIDVLHLRLDSGSTGALGLLVGAAGVGMLSYHALTQRRKP